jgi:hypothetical protein
LDRNIVLLVDSSSSMKEKTKDGTYFRKTTQAIKKVLTNPTKTQSEDYITVIFFWVDSFNRFKTETIYDNVRLNAGVSPEKLNAFGAPPSYAGTGIEKGLDFAANFLEGRQGEKIIKLVTDSAANSQQAREENVFRFYEQGIRLDCIIVNDAKNGRQTLGSGALGQVFQGSDVDAISNVLLS